MGLRWSGLGSGGAGCAGWRGRQCWASVGGRRRVSGAQPDQAPGWQSARAPGWQPTQAPGVARNAVYCASEHPLGPCERIHTAFRARRGRGSPTVGRPAEPPSAWAAGGQVERVHSRWGAASGRNLCGSVDAQVTGTRAGHRIPRKHLRRVLRLRRTGCTGPGPPLPTPPPVARNAAQFPSEPPFGPCERMHTAFRAHPGRGSPTPARLSHGGAPAQGPAHRRLRAPPNHRRPERQVVRRAGLPTPDTATLGKRQGLWSCSTVGGSTSTRRPSKVTFDNHSCRPLTSSPTSPGAHAW